MKASSVAPVSSSPQFIVIFLAILVTLFLLSGCATIPYKDAVSSWKSHEDVGNWLKENFTFDHNRSRIIKERVDEQGMSGLLLKKPEKLYKSRRGYCVDAAHFAIKQLNAINPDYNARWVFISNSLGRPHHWVVAFDYQSKLYIMDYGVGTLWNSMKGIHGPYNSLDEYRDFLSSLSIQDFKAGDVYFRNMPGTED